MKTPIYFLAFLWLCGGHQLHAQSTPLFPMPNAEGKWGYVDAKNKLIIPYKFDNASPFYEERAFIAQKQTNGEVVCSTIDTKGNILFQVNMSEGLVLELYQMHYQHYNEGLFYIPNYENESRTYQYIDKAGKQAISFAHNCGNSGYAKDFSEGLAYVTLTDSTWGQIDTQGKLVLQGKDFAPIEQAFKQGWAVIRTAEGFTYINKKGEKATFLSPYKLEDLGDMQEGYAFMALPPKDTLEQDVRFVILQPDRSIKPVAIKLVHSTPVTYVSGYNFSHGLAYVRYYDSKGQYGEQQGYLNTAGKLAFPLPKVLTPTRKSAEGDYDFYVKGNKFHQGLACWTINYSNNTMKIIYIDTAGKVVLQSSIVKN